METNRTVSKRRAAAQWVFGALPLLAMVTLFTITGRRGINFGDHWDELTWQLDPVREMVSSGVLLPRATLYPAVSKWLVLLPSIPAGILSALHGGGPRDVQALMKATLDAPEYLLTARSTFLFVSALAIVWVYAAALVLGRKWWEASIAAGCLGLSWEYAYHSRWLATDCILVQFAALTLLLLACFRRWENPRWLYASAVAAGLGAGTKFPGVTLLVPVLISSLWLTPRYWSRRPFVQLTPVALRLVALVATAFVAYLISTPATLLDPFLFVEQLSYISRYYAQGHYGYSVTDTLQHLKVVFLYFALSYFSPFRPAALAIAATVPIGALLWFRTDRRTALFLTVFPVLFVAWFGSRYLAVIVRNYLLIAPFLALLAARGVAGLVELGSRPRLRFAWAGVLAAIGVAQAAWLVTAGESIRHVDPERYVAEALRYISKHGETRFRLSERVLAIAGERQLALPANVARDGNAARVVFFARAEGPADGARWQANNPWLTDAVFGPREVNFSCYPSWSGPDRIVVMDTPVARAMGLELAK